MKGYSIDLMLRYSIEKDTRIATFIMNCIRAGKFYHEEMYAIFKSIVKPYYEQREIIRNSKLQTA